MQLTICNMNPESDILNSLSSFLHGITKLVVAFIKQKPYENQSRRRVNREGVRPISLNSPHRSLPEAQAKLVNQEQQFIARRNTDALKSLPQFRNSSTPLKLTKCRTLISDAIQCTINSHEQALSQAFSRTRRAYTRSC